MAFSAPLYPRLFDDSFQKIAEPSDVSDDSVESLYIICCKYFVRNFTSIRIDRPLPSDVCDNLMSLFLTFGDDALGRNFIHAMSSKFCRIVSANLSAFRLSHFDLVDFVHSHARTLKFINLPETTTFSSESSSSLSSETSLTSSEVLLQLSKTLNRVHDNNQLKCVFEVYEVPKECPYREILHQIKNIPCIISKVYHNGIIKTTAHKFYNTACASSYYQNSFLLKSECPQGQFTMESNPLNDFVSDRIFYRPCSTTPKTNYAMLRELGAFCDPQFNEHYLMNEKSIISACPDRSDHYLNQDFFSLIIKPNQFNNSDSSSYFQDDNLKPDHCPYCFGHGFNQSKICINNKRVFFNLFRIHDSNSYIESRSFDGRSSDFEKSSSSKQNYSRYESFLSDDSSLEAVSDNIDSINEDERKRLKFRSNLKKNFRLLNSSGCVLLNTPTVSCKLIRPTQYSKRGKSMRKFMKSASNSHFIPKSDFVEQFCNFMPDENANSEENHAINDQDSLHSLFDFETKIDEENDEEFDEENFIEESFTESSTDTDPNEINQRYTSKSYGPFELNLEEYPHVMNCPLNRANCPADTNYHDFLKTIIEKEIKEDRNQYLNINENDLRFDFFPSVLYIIDRPDYPYYRVFKMNSYSSPPIESISLPATISISMPKIPLTFDDDLSCFDKLHRLTLGVDCFNLKFYSQSKLIKPSTVKQLDLSVPSHFDDRYYRDIDHCKLINTINSFSNLTTLILFNFKDIYQILPAIYKMQTLRFLDISQISPLSQNAETQISTLREILKSLPDLESLDISGTFRAFGIVSTLQARSKRPFKFLGLYRTNIDPVTIPQIPAKKIAGDVYDDLLLNSCEVYMERSSMLKYCLNDLFQKFRHEIVHANLDRVVKILVCALGSHRFDKSIQVAASAILFYIIKSDESKPLLGRVVKKLIVNRLLNAMQNFITDQTMLRNVCLNLIHLRLPNDVLSEYSRLASMLLKIVEQEEDEFVQKLGIYLLNSLACQIDGVQKTIVGDLQAIECMLRLISKRFKRNICDEIMETAWSTMWNVTDENPINCSRFLLNRGMDYFVDCMDKFPNRPELLRNMMGLLGNVSECDDLRYHLRKKDFINRFVMLLDSQSDGIEVSYNSAGILAHLISDALPLWDDPSEPYENDKARILMKMDEAISRWDLNSKRNINYRSFKPILRLLRNIDIVWQAQYWAVWALANLTRVQGAKYCQLLEQDQGVEALKNLVRHKNSLDLPFKVKCLSIVTLFQHFLYSQKESLDSLAASNEIICFNLVPSKQLLIDFLFKYDFYHLASELGIVIDDETMRRSLNKIDKDIVMEEMNHDDLVIEQNNSQSSSSSSSSTSASSNDSEIKDQEMLLL
ncbi:Protein zer-1 -like protein [Sarcoptes scabiei]|uniref:Protein zer-1 -like protein n=1 Tax=Sarcoptes scabiei TaxID=52283 RepID=A0A834R919_SARSC|nr:Protein zer-1 -like protein [Sarcoptes scabiei]